LFPIDLKGKKILLKPNVLRASKAAESIVTNPSVLSAVIRKVELFDPSSITVGDNPGLFNYGANEESFKATGLMDAAKGYFKNIGSDSKKIDFNKYGFATLNVSSAVMDADVVISLPKFKTHGLTVISGAIKNSFGILPGAQKGKLHQAAGSPEQFHELIVDVFSLRVPDLFIVDAVVGMEGNGPASPDLRDVGRILASDNAVALDAVIAEMMGCNPAKLRFLQKAKEVGLGDYDLEKIEIIGELIRIPDYKIPPLGGDVMYRNAAMQEFIQKRSHVLPKANPDLCSGCGLCISHCPVAALSMTDNVPVVDSEICIACFCCQELCPEKAITLQ
jgi:uncharacterized protein (DUF362 family)/Pyruvate/2-oxoacid:ferredoxin oxidoreductase delta subunit